MRTPSSMLWLVVALSSASCLDAWKVGGPWSCSSGSTCPLGFTCDDGLCCKPGGSPACPTLPAPNGTCPDNSMGKLYFEDHDGDGDGNPRLVSVRCRAGVTGTRTLSGSDCDDTDPAIHLGGAELCNGRDDNCDSRVDEGLSPQRDYFLDSDGDGFGQNDVRLSACAAPPGYVEVGGDCAPFDPAKHPGAPERCNGLDDDCDGVPDRSEVTLADVGDDFPCVTAQPGACRDGVFRCAVQPDAGVRRTCRALSTPSREFCDEVDNDCDGLVDEPPDCGGPASLSSARDVTWVAQRITSPTTIATQCQVGFAGNTPETANTATWTGASTGYHVWSIAPADGGTWDLSNPNATFRVAFTSVASGATTADGLWGDPAAPGANRASLNPVVYLCGGAAGEVMRYRLVNAADGFKLNDAAFNRELKLKAVGSGWLIGQGSGFDTTRVNRVELIVQTLSTNFTITFTPDAGFGR